MSEAEAQIAALARGGLRVRKDPDVPRDIESKEIRTGRP